MPCFKGIAVSIHANGAQLPEYGTQTQSRYQRINSYIAVPQPELNTETKKHEPAKFAISITLLTPGLAIPYSTPKPTDDNPNPKPQLVAEVPQSFTFFRKGQGVVGPYIPMTNSENETIAAYIYFDGRVKEEVATLLRPGEETWVNSRWVQVPESEGGGLAEREFLFREVGLERWLNGLDLEGHDAAAKTQKRRMKFERRRRRQEALQNGSGDMDMDGTSKSSGALRYGAADSKSPVEAISEDDSDGESSDDELPEATGQIKVAMFRVLASGEIKKGEYSPQFDAHEDDEEYDTTGKNGGSGTAVEPDVEHTTSFAKPKTLDPTTISTQTVTGIDGPDKPFAIFTFFYRGERQLQKMGVLPSSKTQQPSPAATKRRSAQLDFSNLGPLKSTGTVGFSTFREQDTESSRRRKARKKSNGSIGLQMNDDSDDDDSDNEDKIVTKMEETEDKDTKIKPDEDPKFSGELAAGVDRIRLKRAYSADLDSTAASSVSHKSPSAGPLGGSTTPPESREPSKLGTSIFGSNIPDDAIVGSPLKKHRPSIAEGASTSAIFPPALGDVLAKAEAAQKQSTPPVTAPAVTKAADSDEEL